MYIGKFLDEHDELNAEYHKRYLEKKVFNYLHSYHRIADEFRLEFLERVSKEFESDLKNPKIHVEMLDSWVLAQMNRIIDSPKLFYIEDGMYRQKKEYEEIHKKWLLVRNSEEFKNGLNIKKFLKMKI